MIDRRRATSITRAEPPTHAREGAGREGEAGVCDGMDAADGAARDGAAETVENPAGSTGATTSSAQATSGLSDQRVELEAALKGLKDGSLSEQEAAAVVERLVDARVDGLRAELSTPATARKIFGALVQNMFAYMTEAPTNWHQAVVFFAGSSDPRDAPMKKRLPVMFTMSFLMVAAQCATVVAVIMGTATPACSTNDQCSPGTYCSVGWSNRCQYCGSHAPVIIQYGEDGETYNQPYDRRFVGYNKTYIEELCHDPVWIPTCANICYMSNPDHKVYDRYGPESACRNECDRKDREFSAEGSWNEDGWNIPLGGSRLGYSASGGWTYPMTIAMIENWCDQCVHAATYNVDPLVMTSLIADNVKAMGPFDWGALAFSSFVVAFQVVGELKDIELCILSAHRAADMPTVWHVAIWFVQTVRRWCFLSALVAAVPVLVTFLGGDSLSVCFNTIAIIFMCEIDNLCYHYGLPERTRSRVEDAGRVDLDDAEAEGMARSKDGHIFTIVGTVLAAVWWAGKAWPDSEEGDGYHRAPTAQMATAFVLPVIGLVLVGIFEAAEPKLEHRNKMFGMHKFTLSHVNRCFEISLRTAWIIAVRIATVPLMAAFFGVAAWGFGSKRDEGRLADQETTWAFYESQGENWTSLVEAAVRAGHAPNWNDPNDPN